ncbi:hypothetical protein BDV93DRAFT_504536 [Ceratobasidium sp. AG-I]|nr:hypothetical protein BDV93DRAFT_504536 [Ceratobasidium sp. AG-I]
MRANSWFTAEERSDIMDFLPEMRKLKRQCSLALTTVDPETGCDMSVAAAFRLRVCRTLVKNHPSIYQNIRDPKVFFRYVTLDSCLKSHFEHNLRDIAAVQTITRKRKKAAKVPTIAQKKRRPRSKSASSSDSSPLVVSNSDAGALQTRSASSRKALKDDSSTGSASSEGDRNNAGKHVHSSDSDDDEQGDSLVPVPRAAAQTSREVRQMRLERLCEKRRQAGVSPVASVSPPLVDLTMKTESNDSNPMGGSSSVTQHALRVRTHEGSPASSEIQFLGRKSPLFVDSPMKTDSDDLNIMEGSSPVDQQLNNASVGASPAGKIRFSPIMCCREALAKPSEQLSWPTHAAQNIKMITIQDNFLGGKESTNSRPKTGGMGGTFGQSTRALRASEHVSRAA